MNKVPCSETVANSTLKTLNLKI